MWIHDLSSAFSFNFFSFHSLSTVWVMNSFCNGIVPWTLLFTLYF
jgi:hypothetical protein